METTPNTRTRRPAQAGPPMMAPALAYAVLTVVGTALGASGPRPSTAAAAVITYYAQHTSAATVQAAAVFAAAIPLAVFAAVVYRRLRQLGVTAPGSAIGLAGGVLASGALAASGLVIWTAAASADLGEPAVLRALTTLSFAFGGPGFVPFAALLVAGVAVPSLALGLLPRWLAWTGLVIAGVGMLSVFSLLTPTLYLLLPIGRFGGLLWLIAAAALLPLTRPRRSGPEPAAQAS